MKQTKERPILFSTSMVLAILEGRKTMTRRIIKLQPDENGLWDDSTFPRSLESTLCRWNGTTEATGESRQWKCPYGETGDVLWVREMFRPRFVKGCYQEFRMHYPDERAFYYKSDFPESQHAPGGFGWKPSIHMPREACRLRLQITDIKVERVQDISEEDSINEGAFFTDYGRTCYHNGMNGDISICLAPDTFHPLKRGWSMVKTTSHEQCLASGRSAFISLWNKINGHESWDQNMWVWALTFKII